MGKPYNLIPVTKSKCGTIVELHPIRKHHHYPSDNFLPTPNEICCNRNLFFPSSVDRTDIGHVHSH